MIKMKESKAMRSKNKTSEELPVNPKILITKDFIIIVIISIVLTLCMVLGARKLRSERELQKAENNNVVENVTEDNSDETKYPYHYYQRLYPPGFSAYYLK